MKRQTDRFKTRGHSKKSCLLQQFRSSWRLRAAAPARYVDGYVPKTEEPTSSGTA